jgi:hypothetical protein
MNDNIIEIKREIREGKLSFATKHILMHFLTDEEMDYIQLQKKYTKLFGRKKVRRSINLLMNVGLIFESNGQYKINDLDEVLSNIRTYNANRNESHIFFEKNEYKLSIITKDIFKNKFVKVQVKSNCLTGLNEFLEMDHPARLTKLTNSDELTEFFDFSIYQIIEKGYLNEKEAYDLYAIHCDDSLSKYINRYQELYTTFSDNLSIERGKECHCVFLGLSNNL